MCATTSKEASANPATAFASPRSSSMPKRMRISGPIATSAISTTSFRFKTRITERIVTAIEPTVRAVEIKRALAKPTDSLTAYDLYLRALPNYHSQTAETLKRAEVLLDQAIALDPEYPEALGTLADCIAARTLNGWHESRTRGRDEACEAARRALVAGPDNSTCVAAAAFAYAVLAGRFEEALELAERAIELHPNSAFVRNRAGAVYTNPGESDKAIAQFESAQRMNPRDNKTSTFTFGRILGALRAPLRGKRPLGTASPLDHAGRERGALECRRVAWPSRPHRRGARGSHPASKTGPERIARALPRIELPARMDV